MESNCYTHSRLLFLMLLIQQPTQYSITKMGQVKRIAIREIELVKCSLLDEGGTILFFRNSTPTFVTSA
jgi:hypothetical protein